jgi:hypothetical protein
MTCIFEGYNTSLYPIMEEDYNRPLSIYTENNKINEKNITNNSCNSNTMGNPTVNTANTASNTTGNVNIMGNPTSNVNMTSNTTSNVNTMGNPTSNVNTTSNTTSNVNTMGNPTNTVNTTSNPTGTVNTTSNNVNTNNSEKVIQQSVIINENYNPYEKYKYTMLNLRKIQEFLISLKIPYKIISYLSKENDFCITCYYISISHPVLNGSEYVIYVENSPKKYFKPYQPYRGYVLKNGLPVITNSSSTAYTGPTTSLLTFKQLVIEIKWFIQRV